MYIFAYSSPVIVFLSLYWGGGWSFLALGYVFGLIPVLELFFTGNDRNLEPEAEAAAANNRWYDVLLYSFVPIQLGLMLFYLNRMEDGALLWYERTGMMIAFGFACGVMGINTAHELGHRSTWYEQLMSKILLATSQYMHFFIEHNRGHHKHVATELDPATGRYGETLYAFYVRSISMSWLSAWRLEADRLRKAGKQVWSLHNEMLRFQLIQASMLAAIAAIWNMEVMLWYLGSATIGFLLLETVNYIEHYGLSRKKTGAGKQYERTLPVHSWNSNHSLGRILLLELSRHSDHHYMATRKYQTLRHFEESPQMPTGYPGMMLLSFIPPLWFWVMHRQIAKYRLQREPAWAG